MLGKLLTFGESGLKIYRDFFVLLLQLFCKSDVVSKKVKNFFLLS